MNGLGLKSIPGQGTLARQACGEKQNARRERDRVTLKP